MSENSGIFVFRAREEKNTQLFFYLPKKTAPYFPQKSNFKTKYNSTLLEPKMYTTTFRHTCRSQTILNSEKIDEMGQVLEIISRYYFFFSSEIRLTHV